MSSETPSKTTVPAAFLAPRAGDRRRPERATKAKPRWSWTLGRIFGIEVKLHATFLILLGWVAISHLSQGHGLGAAAAGLLLVLAVFGIVVLHELGHALTARRFGIRTRDITLFPFGGIAALERMPEKPSQELLVALAGPAVNVVLAIGLAALVLATGGTLVPADMHVVGGPLLTKLVFINVTLALFNLLPAFPMDGGRALRAALAFRLPYPRATEIAARIGQGMALLLGALGLFTNPMLLVIALFVWMGAQQESTTAQLQAVLGNVPVQNAMITDFRTLSPEQPLARVAGLILGGFQHDFPVVDDGVLVGVVTRDDVIRGMAEGGPDMLVQETMRRDFATADPSEPLTAAFARLQQLGAASLVVLRDRQVLGIITPENIGEWVLLETAQRGRAAPARPPT